MEHSMAKFFTPFNGMVICFNVFALRYEALSGVGCHICNLLADGANLTIGVLDARDR
jgi:hypothetical protein